MKKLAAILCLSALTTGAFAQGLVNFFNSSTTLSSATVNGTSAATSGAPGSYYYGLLIGSGNNANAFTFTGNYATNLSVRVGSPVALTWRPRAGPQASKPTTQWQSGPLLWAMISRRVG